MSETTYSLEWRGARKSGFTYADIEAGLASGDLHTLYKINVNGTWMVLRDFVEQQRVLLAPPPAEQLNPPPPEFQSSFSSLPRPDPLPTQQQAVRLRKAEPPPQRFPAPTAGAAAQKPVWFWPVIILFSTVLLLLLIMLAYRAATSRPGSQQTRGSSSHSSGVKTSHSTAAPRDKPDPSSTSRHNLTNEEIADLKSPYVVKISALWMEPDPKTGKLAHAGSSGSGVHIKNEKGYAYFVTNRHVVSVPKKAQDIECSLVFNGVELPFEVVKLGRYELDLAMVRSKYEGGADNASLQSVRLKDLKPGQECVAIGNALGAGISVTTGVISAFDEWGEGRFVRTSAPISSGNSGGGLFRTKDGALIGITTMASGAGRTSVVQNFNLAIPMDYVLSDLFWEDN